MNKKQNIEISLSNSSGDSCKQEIDLTGKNYLNKKTKEKKPYDLNDLELKTISLNENLKVRLIANDNGYFIDLRKYFKGYPTKKGIRILATKFIAAADMLKKDVDDIFKPAKKDN